MGKSGKKGEAKLIHVKRKKKNLNQENSKCRDEGTGSPGTIRKCHSADSSDSEVKNLQKKLTLMRQDGKKEQRRAKACILLTELTSNGVQQQPKGWGNDRKTTTRQ